MVAGDVRRWSECLPALFEHGSVELEFVQALAEEPFKEIDVRCPAYAEYSASSEHIHMYSFALHPHDVQPSGHFTFRNIKRPSLSIQLKETEGCRDQVLHCGLQMDHLLTRTSPGALHLRTSEYARYLFSMVPARTRKWCTGHDERVDDHVWHCFGCRCYKPEVYCGP